MDANEMHRRRFLSTVALGTVAAHTAAWAQSYEVRDWAPQVPTPTMETLDLQGARVRLTEFKGRVVLLNFWASWCEPCRAEMPTLQQLPGLLGEDRVAVVCLNFKESSKRIARYVQTAGITLPIWLDPQGEIARAWGASVFPTTVLIDRTGRARQRIRGEVDWSDRVALGWIERLLAT